MIRFQERGTRESCARGDGSFAEPWERFVTDALGNRNYNGRLKYAGVTNRTGSPDARRPGRPHLEDMALRILHENRGLPLRRRPSPQDMITFQRTALLRFYDDKQDDEFKSNQRGAHVSAITGVIGEELLLGLLFHCLNGQTPPIPCKLLEGKPRRGGELIEGKRSRGNWLDAWVQLGADRLAQVEIKNWSAHSLGEKSLATGASNSAIEAAAKARWKAFFGNNDKMPASTAKIKLDYLPPKDFLAKHPVERVLCFWLPLAQDAVQPLTTTVIDGKEVTVFSASIYLRQLPLEFLELHCPLVEARFALLASLQGPAATRSQRAIA